MLSMILLLLAMLFISRLYTTVTFFLLALLLISLLIFKVEYLGRFFISYVIVLVPFLIVNGILTGSGLNEQVVWYNDMENLGLRILTIPVEDVFYGMLLILGNVSLYEFFQKSFK